MSQPDHDQQQCLRWGEGSDDDVVAAAIIDRLFHHAEVIALEGEPSWV
jgi:DNA replication protein DnaC